MFPRVASQWQTNNLTTTGTETAALTGYHNVTPTIVDAVYETLHGCLSGYSSNVDISLLDRFDTLPRQYPNICSMVRMGLVNSPNPAVSPDIAGVGVSCVYRRAGYYEIDLDIGPPSIRPTAPTSIVGFHPC